MYLCNIDKVSLEKNALLTDPCYENANKCIILYKIQQVGLKGCMYKE